MGTDTSQNNSEVDSNRGIKNAEARFREHSQNRLTSEQLQKPRERDTRRPQATSQRGSVNARINGTHPADLKIVYRNIRELFATNGQKIEDSDIREMSELKTGHVDTPPFPFFILLIAILKDTIDVIGTIFLIGAPLTMFFSFIMSLILFFWTLGKMSGGWWKKMAIRGILVKYGITVAIEMVPLVNIVPTTTIFILLVHFREKKVVKLINLGLEKMHYSGLR